MLGTTLFADSIPPQTRFSAGFLLPKFSTKIFCWGADLIVKQLNRGVARRRREKGADLIVSLKQLNRGKATSRSPLKRKRRRGGSRDGLKNRSADDRRPRFLCRRSARERGPTARGGRKPPPPEHGGTGVCNICQNVVLAKPCAPVRRTGARGVGGRKAGRGGKPLIFCYRRKSAYSALVLTYCVAARPASAAGGYVNALDDSKKLKVLVKNLVTYIFKNFLFMRYS